MSIRRLNLILFLALLALLFALFGSLGAVVRTRGRITKSEERRLRSVRLADELRQSSDDLTRMARLYVTTGEEHYKTWFHEILAIQEPENTRQLLRKLPIGTPATSLNYSLKNSRKLPQTLVPK